ncbi:hypothetical protein [Streptomyces sp. NPDC015131]|uniref:hypothetical protein n=1 Tax=Streptomyces sp. NPDC015131 TaxID=3364941 RepID=UPI0036F94711
MTEGLILVPTLAAVADMLPPGVTVGDLDAAELERYRRRIYNWARHGKLKQYGGTGKDQALWNLFEIRALRGV